MAYFLFVLVNAALFLRPAELLPALRGVPIYEALILSCMALSAFSVWQMLSDGGAWRQPLTWCVFGLWALIAFSLVVRGEFEKAGTAAFEFFKVVVYYLLLVSLVDTPGRLRNFLFWVMVFAGVISVLAVLNYHQIIDLATLRAVEDRRDDDPLNEQVMIRLAGTGIFNDPNDYCLLLTIAVPLALYHLLDGFQGFARLLPLALLGVFAYALVLTKSRGGLAAVVAGMLVMLWLRYGVRAALLALLALLPPAALFFAMRQTDLTSGEDTGQHRIQLWSDAFVFLKEAPLWGVGADEFSARAGLVAHNSFLHVYGELGLIGGSLFFGAFAYALWALYRLHARRYEIDPTARALNPYLMGIVAGAVALMTSLSRAYIVPVYMILGIVTAHVRLAQARLLLPELHAGGALVQRLAVASVGYLAVMYVLVRLLVRF